MLLNQPGRTSHADICASLELFAREVMPECHARKGEQHRWRADVLARRLGLEEVAATVYACQNEDIVRLAPEEVKRKMADKEAAARRPHA